MPQNTDIAIIGAGPSGCIAALAFAQQGANVTLIEAHPETRRRLAGEWLHPAAVDIMKRLNVPAMPTTEQHPPTQGFVAYPHDGGDPIPLDYADGQTGMTCGHHILVDTLRKTATAHPLVCYMPHTRSSHIAGQHLTVENTETGQTATLVASTIVGASGRFSSVRKALGLSNKCTLLSYMAGVLLNDVEMPFEGLGHVFLGGPGPILAYRLNARQVRLCIDVPIDAYRQNKNRFLSEAYTSAIPEPWREAFHETIRNGDVAWASNQHRSRANYGRQGLALIGDAAGFFHPVTAIGMTMGFQDGMCLSQSQTFESYRRCRQERSHVPELLALSLHDFFTCKNPGATTMCEGIYRMWRTNATERRRTMQILSGEKTDVVEFNKSFLTGVSTAARQVLSEKRRWRDAPFIMGYMGKWLHRLASNTYPFKAITHDTE